MKGYVRTKRYIRTQGGMFIDTAKTIVFVEAGAVFPQLCIEDLDTADYFVVCVERESDNILDLLQIGDLIKITNNDNLIGDKFVPVDELIEVDENFIKENKFMDFELLNIYIKQGDDYILVWDKERGVI